MEVLGHDRKKRRQLPLAANRDEGPAWKNRDWEREKKLKRKRLKGRGGGPPACDDRIGRGKWSRVQSACGWCSKDWAGGYLTYQSGILQNKLHTPLPSSALRLSINKV